MAGLARAEMYCVDAVYMVYIDRPMYLGSSVIYTPRARCSTKSDAFRGPTQISLPDHYSDNSYPVLFLLAFMRKELCLCVVQSVCVFV